MTRRVVVTDYTFPDLVREKTAAEAAGAEFIAHQCRSAGEVTEAVAGADVVLLQFAPMTGEAIAGLAEGATIVRYGIGYDNIDLEAANAHGVAVGFVPDYCLDEVADHTVALILMLLRKIPAFDESVRQGKWAAVDIAKPLPPYGETTVGLLGLGQIGRSVLERLRPSGFRFIVCDPALDAAGAQSLGVTPVDPDTLVAEADVLSLHVPATEETIHFINAERLSRMKATAAVVNTARGALVDENALARALIEGTIAFAALDVFETEPLLPDSPLRGAPNLVMTPHAAWYSEAAIARLQALVADDVSRVLAGGRPRKPVPGTAGAHR